MEKIDTDYKQPLIVNGGDNNELELEKFRQNFSRCTKNGKKIIRRNAYAVICFTIKLTKKLCVIYLSLLIIYR